ncbi:MAG: NAD(P)-dependent oxidoreductase, partial [Acidobacteriota bacterium]|nr:NAD(P)-dependent oxidoreductase [Acidobacteriota bacterium]
MTIQIRFSPFCGSGGDRPREEPGPDGRQRPLEQAPLFPVGLALEDRPCLVVGGGRVAARKVAALLACRARVTLVAPEAHVALGLL